MLADHTRWIHIVCQLYIFFLIKNSILWEGDSQISLQYEEPPACDSSWGTVVLLWQLLSMSTSYFMAHTQFYMHIWEQRSTQMNTSSALSIVFSSETFPAPAGVSSWRTQWPQEHPGAAASSFAHCHLYTFLCTEKEKRDLSAPGKMALPLWPPKNGSVTAKDQDVSQPHLESRWVW